MPYTDAADYRFNPFDLTKIWPHGDYPLIKVGRFVLNRNPENYFAQIEQAAFEPSNLVPGIGTSPDKMLQGRLFAYPDAHRYRIGANYMDLPVNRPVSEVNSYSKDGQMRYSFGHGDPVYAPNSYGGPHADSARSGEDEAPANLEQEVLRSAYALHSEDDDFGQPGAMVRNVFSDEERARFIDNVAGHINGGVTKPIQDKALNYWRSVDKATGDKIAEKVQGA